MKLRRAHHRNRFTIFRISDARGVGLMEDHGIAWTAIKGRLPRSAPTEGFFAS